MFKHKIDWFLLVAVIAVLGTTGCQTASNMIAGLRGRRPAVTSVAGTPAVTSTAMAQTPSESPYPRTSSGSASYAAMTGTSAPSEKDSLKGFYPEDVAEESSDTNAGDCTASGCSSGSCSSSRSGSFSSGPSGGCSSGCCSR